MGHCTWKYRKINGPYLFLPMDFRIGFGYDVHRLENGRLLVIGGLAIPHPKGGQGHSDADVLIHALIDALLGAAGLRDIGYQFPNTDPSLKNMDSKILLQKTMELIKGEGFSVGNADMTICIEQPKIAPHIPEMQKVLSDILGVETGLVSIKATTEEGVGFTGRQEGMKAYAVVLLKK